MQPVRAFLVAGALACSASAALAAPALVVSDLNLRTGPGTQYPSVTVIPGGSTVNVFECQRGWCAVSAFGRNGFVSDNYLDFGDPGRSYGPPPPPPPVVYERPAYGPPPMYGPPPPPPPYYGRPYRPWRYRW